MSIYLIAENLRDSWYFQLGSSHWRLLGLKIRKTIRHGMAKGQIFKIFLMIEMKWWWLINFLIQTRLKTSSNSFTSCLLTRLFVLTKFYLFYLFMHSPLRYCPKHQETKIRCLKEWVLNTVRFNGFFSRDKLGNMPPHVP